MIRFEGEVGNAEINVILKGEKELEDITITLDKKMVTIGLLRLFNSSFEKLVFLHSKASGYPFLPFCKVDFSISFFFGSEIL